MSTTLLNTATSRIQATKGRGIAIVAAAALAAALIGPSLAFADEPVTVEATASGSLVYAMCAAEGCAIEQVATEAQNDPVTTVLATAYSLQGTPYRAGGATPQSGFDCSGFTMYCFAQAGISLTHNASAQFNQGTSVDRADLQPGDLVFFGGRSINHVGIYVGDGQYIHSKQTGDDVCIENLADRNNYAGAVRVV